MKENDDKVKTQRLNLLRELCKKLEVSYPAELASTFVKQDNKFSKPSMPPKKLMDAMIKETKNLINKYNNVYLFEISKLGIVLHVNIWWTDDNFASFEIFDIQPIMKYKNACTIFLLDKLQNKRHSTFYETMLQEMWDEYEKKITSSKEYKAIDSRIIKVCEQSDKWEKKYEDFEWDADILTAAGG